VIDLLPEQRAVAEKGATMRLGAYPCVLTKDTKAHRAYGTQQISERHRHRFEVNPELRDQLSRAGLVFSGVSPDGHLVEVIEVADHPWFVACQYHPEFKSRPFAAHPLFDAFVQATITHQRARKG
jgi:CTP synthase